MCFSSFYFWAFKEPVVSSHPLIKWWVVICHKKVIYGISVTIQIIVQEEKGDHATSNSWALSTNNILYQLAVINQRIYTEKISSALMNRWLNKSIHLSFPEKIHGWIDGSKVRWVMNPQKYPLLNASKDE